MTCQDWDIGREDVHDASCCLKIYLSMFKVVLHRLFLCLNDTESSWTLFHPNANHAASDQVQHEMQKSFNMSGQGSEDTSPPICDQP